MKTLLLILPLCIVSGTPAAANPSTTQAAVDDLLAADRDFAAAAATTDMITGLTAMLDAQGIVAAPSAKFARGPAEVAALLRTNPLNAPSRVAWAPVRGGISADGQQGFTFGHLTVTRENGVKEPAKYLSYWIRRPTGWRVLAYQRSRRPEGTISTAMLPPSLPKALVKPQTNPRRQAALRASLAAAEKSFSDLAQRTGLRSAFGAIGTDDAVLISVGTDFVIGGKNVAREAFGPETTSAVNWSSDATETASSGDLGLSWGVVRPNPGAKGTPFSYFTIWRRDAPDGEWRFIAE